MSGAEREVADFLKKLNLWWIYQAPVFVYHDKERPRVWTPDFYLSNLGIYIEVCGREDIDYAYRERIYKKNRFNVIFLHLFKENSWKNYLIKRIFEIENYRHDETLKIIRSFKF
ncbi:MAG: hypothetical protein ACPLIG_03270 [Candidatus Bathyarchaeales archaeon]